MNFLEGAIFNIGGFKKSENIRLFNRLYETYIEAESDDIDSGITIEQNSIYCDFEKNKSLYEDLIMKALINEDEHAVERFVINFILISQSGKLAIIFNDKLNYEDGLVVQLLPNFQVLTQLDFF